MRILIIKLAALGDVVRTTFLLPALAAKYPGVDITWLTQEDAVPLLQHNPCIRQIVTIGNRREIPRGFDLIINLDEDAVACEIASELGAPVRGYFLRDSRIVCSAEAEYWMQMSLLGGADRDLRKQRNRRTFQEIMAEIAGVSFSDTYKPVIVLTDEERKLARTGLTARGIVPGEPVAGVNTGAGGRWPMKQLDEPRTMELIRGLRQDGFQVLLLGGGQERARNTRMQEVLADPGVLAVDTEKSLRGFAAVIGECDALISSDSLAMHIGIALGVYTVAFFGPTPAAEIYFYNHGCAIQPALACATCMGKQMCDKHPNCMELIPLAEIRRLVARALPGRGSAAQADASAPK